MAVSVCKCGARPRPHTQVSLAVGLTRVLSGLRGRAALRTRSSALRTMAGHLHEDRGSEPQQRCRPFGEHLAGSGHPRLGSAGDTSLVPSQGEDRRGLPEDMGCEPRVPTRRARARDARVDTEGVCARPGAADTARAEAARHVGPGPARELGRGPAGAGGHRGAGGRGWRPRPTVTGTAPRGRGGGPGRIPQDGRDLRP